MKRTPDGQKPDPYEVTGASPAGFTKMDLDSSSAFFIGGFPTNFMVNLIVTFKIIVLNKQRILNIISFFSLLKVFYFQLKMSHLPHFEAVARGEGAF